MKKRSVYIVLGAIFVLAALLRVLALVLEPPHHPDEYFQYLEPAWLRLRGAGVETWEWRDGVRSWFLPGYHGAWMAVLMRLGLRNGRALIAILQAHWALLSMAIVWAGWRSGCVLSRWGRQTTATLDETSPPDGWQGGLLAAFLCATFPLLVRFSVHTFSELASIICLVCALALTADVAERGAVLRSRKVILLGLLLGVGVCLRIQHTIVPFFAGLWLLWMQRSRTFLAVSALVLMTIGLFGLLDHFTWGEFFASYVRYVKFNLVEGGSAIFGTSSSGWYWEQFLHRLPIGIYALAAICVFGLRANWPFVGSAVGLVVLLSTQGHKEERFVMLCWPLLLIAAAGTIGSWLRRLSRTESQTPSRLARLRWPIQTVAGLVIALVLVDGALHCKGNDFAGLSPDRFAAHAWIARQPDVTGLLYDEPLYVPGYMGFSHSFPQLEARAPLLGNPIFSHVLVARTSGFVSDAERAGFTQVFSAGEFVVLHRSALVQN